MSCGGLRLPSLNQLNEICVIFVHGSARSKWQQHEVGVYQWHFQIIGINQPSLFEHSATKIYVWNLVNNPYKYVSHFKFEKFLFFFSNFFSMKWSNFIITKKMVHSFELELFPKHIWVATQCTWKHTLTPRIRLLKS